MVNMVSDADDMISQFEQAFGELKIELIMGSSLQTAVVSFRILQKVENIGEPKFEFRKLCDSANFVNRESYVYQSSSISQARYLGF